MADAAIRAEGLTRYFGPHKVVDTVSFAVPRGTVYGLLGRNGAGKSTTIRMLLGLLHPTRGRSTLLGCDSETLTPASKARVGFMAEDHPLYTWMRVAEHAEFFRPYYPAWDEAWFRATIERFGLDPGQKIKSLSRGQRAQAALAYCLAARPELLIMDDPMLGLDPVVRRDVLESIIEIIQEDNRTVLFSTHQLGDIERVADRIGVIESGVLRADCALATFKERVRRVRCAFAGDERPGLALPGVLRVRWLDRAATVTVAPFDESHLDALRAAGAREVEVLDAGLEDLFIDYTAPLSGRR